MLLRSLNFWGISCMVCSRREHFIGWSDIAAMGLAAGNMHVLLYWSFACWNIVVAEGSIVVLWSAVIEPNLVLLYIIFLDVCCLECWTDVVGVVVTWWSVCIIRGSLCGGTLAQVPGWQ